MNCLLYTSEELERGFPVFLDGLKEGDIKTEYLLPRIIDLSLIHI